MNWMIECHLKRVARLAARVESSFWEGSVLCIEMVSDKSVAASNILRPIHKIISCVIQLTLFWCILFLRRQFPICYSPKKCDPRPRSNSPWYQFRNNTVAVLHIFSDQLFKVGHTYVSMRQSHNSFSFLSGGPVEGCWEVILGRSLPTEPNYRIIRFIASVASLLCKAYMI